MSSGPMNKAISDTQWESHKDTIKSMYLEANLKLQGSDGLMGYMARVHSFSPSKAQYERQLTKWGFSKNRGQNDWKALSHKISKRKKVGKDSEIYMNNKLVSKAKVHRQITRYGTCSTIANNFQEATSPRTPEGFTIRTPEAAAPRLILPNWTANLPFFRLEAHMNLIPEFSIASMSTKNIELQGFIDPRMLHIFNNNAPDHTFESGSVAGNLLPSLQPPNLGQINFAYDESMPNPEQLVAMLKSWVPKSAVESLLAVQSNSISPEERVKSILSKMIVFSTANSFVQFHNLPTNMVQCLNFSMGSGILKSLQHAGGLEMEALAENLFLAAIEAENANLVKLLLLKTGLDCNKLVCFAEGRRYTPVERSSELRSIEVTRHLLDFKADVNKTLEISEYCGALSLALSGKENQSCADLSLERMLLQAGAEVKPGMLSSVIEQANLSLVELLLSSIDERNRAAWIENKILESAILYLDHQSALSIITRIIQAGACPVNDISPRSRVSLMTALNKAVEFGSAEQVQYLLSAGAQRTTKTLNLAISSSKIEMLQFLLSSGMSPTEINLNTAVSGGNIELVQIILSYNVRPTQETLLLAIRSRNKEVVELIVDSGADPDGLHESGTTPLAEAILSQDERIIQLLSVKGAWSNISEKSRFLAVLKAASEMGEIDIIQRLLVTQVNFEVIDLSGPLAAAMRANHIEIATMLLDAGADRNIYSRECDEKGLLAIAVKTKNQNLVRLVLDSGADVNERYRDDDPAISSTPLEEAVEWGDQAVIKDLLNSGARINMGLRSAVKRGDGDVQVVQILLDAGANIHYSDCYSHCTVLRLAVENCDIKMTETLLSNGAAPDDSSAIIAASIYCKPLFLTLLESFKRVYPAGKKGFGSRALCFSILNKDIKLMDMLLDYRLDPNSFTDIGLKLEEIVYYGNTVDAEHNHLYELLFDIQNSSLYTFGYNYNIISPLGLAILKDQGKNISIIQRLLGAGGDPNSIVVRGEQNWTALLAAIETKNFLTVRLLLNAGADINRPATCGIKRTPIQRAAEIGNFDIVHTLLNEKASVNAEPAREGGGTALQLAAIGGWVGIAELLLDWGADPNAPASKINGRNAVEGAAEHGRFDMLRLLFNAGARIDQQLFERSCRLAEGNGHLATKKYLEELYLESLSGVDLLGS